MSLVASLRGKLWPSRMRTAPQPAHVAPTAPALPAPAMADAHDRALYHERIGLALDLFVRGVQPFVERRLKAVHGERWMEMAQASLRSHRDAVRGHDVVRWDAQLILIIMTDQWHSLFRDALGPLERSLVSELREFRNQWAHQGEFTFDDAYRVVDSVRRLLSAVDGEGLETATEWQRDLLQNHVPSSAAPTPVQTRRRLPVVIIFSLCAAAIIVQAYLAFGARSLIFSVCVVATFTYLLIRKLYFEEASSGVYECPRCNRIVYTRECPYCANSRLV